MNVELSSQQIAWVFIQDVLMRQMHLEPEKFQGTPPFVAPGAWPSPGALLVMQSTMIPG
jgi:hypothetical protein